MNAGKRAIKPIINFRAGVGKSVNKEIAGFLFAIGFYETQGRFSTENHTPEYLNRVINGRIGVY